MLTKFCNGCKVEKPVEDFAVRTTRPDGRQSRCRKCLLEWSRSYYKEHPEKRRKSGLKHAYGITDGDRARLLNNQNGLCRICDRPFSETLKPYIDHSHKTGKVRGILCHHCNTALGMLNENHELFLKAIKYLSEADETLN